MLLEHQSTPDPWLRLRLLKYSIRIWERDRRQHPDEEHLRPIVPVVWFQGERGWRHAREFSELFAEAQLVLMAAYRADWPVLRELVTLLAELAQAAGTKIYDRSRRTLRSRRGTESAGNDLRRQCDDRCREGKNW